MKTNKIRIMLRLNWITLSKVADRTNGATLVFSNKGRVKLLDLQIDKIGAKIKGKTVYYKIEGGDVIGEFDKEFMRNYSKVRVLTFWDSIEQFEGSDLQPFCVSRNIRKPELPTGGIVAGSSEYNEHVNKGERIVTSTDELHKVMTDGMQRQREAKQCTDEDLKMARKFTKLYQDIEPRIEFCATISAIATILSVAACIASIISLIIVAV